jgi:preprotein translocase subunit SecG
MFHIHFPNHKAGIAFVVFVIVLVITVSLLETGAGGVSSMSGKEFDSATVTGMKDNATIATYSFFLASLFGAVLTLIIGCTIKE